MAVQKPLVFIGGRTKQLPSGDSLAITFSWIGSLPTTLAGYGITDAVDTSSAQSIAGQKVFTAAALKIGAGAGIEALYINGGAGSVRTVLFQSASVTRWVFGADNTAETGSNAGSSFALAAYDDAGATLGTVFTIARATRVLDFSVVPTVAGSAIVVDSIADADTTHAPSRNAVFDALAGKQATIADSGWIAPTLQNGWVDFGTGFATAGYRKIGNQVMLRGVIKGGTTTINTVLFTLPAGYYDSTGHHVFNCLNNGESIRVDIRDNGDVRFAATASAIYISLDGVVLTI
jgi:hypothetical protein